MGKINLELIVRVQKWGSDGTIEQGEQGNAEEMIGVDRPGAMEARLERRARRNRRVYKRALIINDEN